jgi:hypothetical protein
MSFAVCSRLIGHRLEKGLIGQVSNIRCAVLAIFFLVDGGGAVEAASYQGLNLRFHRSPDVPLKRLDRPLRETDRPPAPKRLSVLTQTEAIAIAKIAAKEELGTTFRRYEVRSVFFDPTKQEWSVSFDLPSRQRNPTSCVTVFVHDETRTPDVLRCS